MAIHCRAAKNSLSGTLPRCTAGVAEPVLCSSRCSFLTSCGCQLSGTSGLFLGLCLGLHLPLSSARPSPSERPLSWACSPDRLPRSRSSILSLQRFSQPPASPLVSTPLFLTDFLSLAGPAAKSSRLKILLAPQVEPRVGPSA